MNLDNPVLLLPFLLALFFFAFLLEALVLYFSRLEKLGRALGISVAVNLVSGVLVFYAAGKILSLFGFDVAQFNGLNFEPQVVAFLWWFCTVAEGFLLMLFFRQADLSRLFAASAVMNVLSFLFLYGFVALSH